MDLPLLYGRLPVGPGDHVYFAIYVLCEPSRSSRPVENFFGCAVTYWIFVLGYYGFTSYKILLYCLNHWTAVVIQSIVKDRLFLYIL